jgi:hypothetical protein
VFRLLIYTYKYTHNKLFFLEGGSGVSGSSGVISSVIKGSKMVLELLKTGIESLCIPLI